MAESNDYWQMLAEQESGLTAEDNNQWAGDVFNSGADAEAFASNPNYGFLSDRLNPENELYSAGMVTEQNSGTDFNSGFAERDGEGFSITGAVKKGAITFNSFVESILGPKETQKMYGDAIKAGIAAILQGSQNDAYIKYKNADREDSQAHDKELLAEKYKREDEARARKNAMPQTRGRVAYNPNATTGYRVPGAANTQTYGLLKG